MKPFYESIFMPGDPFPVKGFITTTMEHVEVHPHWHTVTEILYYMQGSALQQVNDSIFTAEPGDIVVIGKDQLHSTYSTGKGQSRIMVLQFDAGTMLLSVCRDHTSQPKSDFSNETIYNNPIKTGSDEGRRLLQCVKEIYDELRGGKPAFEYMIQSAVFSLAGRLERHCLYTVAPDNPESRKSMRTMLERSFSLVDEYYADVITLERAAQASSLSTTHFCRLFKKATGMTFHEYLTFYRINRAEKLLDSPRKLTEIAFMCGFGSVTSFIRSFKKYKGCTPSSYTLGAIPAKGIGRPE